MAASVPAYTIGGITRPALFFDDAGNIILTPAATEFAATYGTKALYYGLPANTPYPPVAPTLSVPTDANAGANTVLENAAAGAQVGLTVLATNFGGPPVQYSLTDAAAGGRFQINANSGVVTVAPGAVLDVDPVGTSVGHTIDVKATDGILTTSQSFTIAVGDVNDNNPVFTSSTTASTPENITTPTVVYTAVAPDGDRTAANSTVKYSLASGVGDNDLFTINQNTGAVRFNAPPDFDAPQDSGGNNVYNITVTASDGLPAHNVTRNVAITVTDLNEAPVITSNGGGSTASVSLNEGATGVTSVTATDPDVQAQTLTYSLVTGAGSPDKAKFNIDPSSGNLTFVTPPNFEAFGSAANNNTYIVQVQVTDSGNPLLNDIQTITVNVQDVNESTPVITSSAAMTVDENAAAAAPVGSVVATDADGSAPNNTITYTATGGTDISLFDVNPTTGEITVSSSAVLDREAATSYTLDVKAADGGGLFTTQTLTISLNDLNDNSPDITSAVAMAVDENSASGTHVGTVVATDADATSPNNALTYTSTGGTGQTLFDVNASTGEITVSSSAVLDRELAGTYTLEIKVADGGGHATTQTIAINLNDLNDNTPSFTSAAAMSINEASPDGAAVGTVVAIDADATAPNNAVTYAATGGSGLALFDVNPTTGAVTVHSGAVLDFETTPSYALDVRATDGSGLFTTQTLTISVGNLAPAFATPPDSNASTNQTFGGAAPGSSTRLDAAAFDPAGGTVTFTLLDDFGGRFAIDSGTGVVTVGATPIVFSDPFHPSNTYTVTVRASDASGAHTDQTFDIAVLPETPPEVTAGHTLNYTENQAATAIDTTLTVTDANNAALTGATVQITTNYANGEDLLAFANTAGITGSFNAGNGTLTLSGVDTVANYQAALRAVTYVNTSDNPSAAARTVTFTANDGVVTSGATGTITVTPVNDAPSVGASHSLVYSENQAATAIDTALTLTDVDSAEITGATVQITGNYAAGEDFLAFVDTPNITGTFVAGTLTLTGTDTVANYQAALRAVTYFNNSDTPSSLSRTITFTSSDGAATSTLVTDTIIVTPTNDAPEVVAGHALNYAENDTPTEIDAAVTVADVDSANLTSATVQITGNYVDGEDVLSFVDQNGITGSFNATTGILSLSGSSSVANYQAAIRSVTYSNTSSNPSALDRTVTFIASDGAASSAAVTSIIHVAPVNSAPDLTLDAPGPTAYTENAAATALLSSGAVVDPDAPPSFALGSFTAAVTANAAAGDQIVLLGSAPFAVIGTSLFYSGDLVGTITGLGTISVSVTNLTAIATPTVVNLLAKAFGFQNTNEAPTDGPRTVTFTFHDGGNTGGGDLFNSVTQTVNVTAVNDAPVNTVPTALQLTDTTTNLAIGGLSVSDADAGGGSVTTTLHVTNGTLVVASAGGAVVGGSGTNTVTLTGSIAQINTTLAAANNILYQPGVAGSDTLTVTTSDGGNSGDDPSTVGQPDTGTGTTEQDVDTVSILVTAPPAATAPVVDLDIVGGGTGSDVGFSEGDAAVLISAAASVIDASSATLVSATITLTNRQADDELSVNTALLPGPITSSGYNPATGVLTLSGAGTPAEYAAALQLIKFFNGSENPVTGTRSIAVVVNDASDASNTAIATVQVAGSNDAPAVDLDGGGAPVDYATNYVATGSFIAIAAPAATVTDADNATLESATVVLTNAQTDDVLAISGALPNGITAGIVTAGNLITVTLTGPASAADFQAALKQVVFANGGTSPNLTPRLVDVTVNDGGADSLVATTTITVAANSAPVANDDAASAIEAGGINNTVAGANPSGNVITGVGGADTDAQDGAAGLTVVAVKTGPESAPVTTGVVGTALQGAYGKLTLNANGSYSYALDNGNATVQGLTSASLPIFDVFNYIIQDSGGAPDAATLTITISGADDLVQAVADSRTIIEDAAPTTFTVLGNDTLDPDAGALNTITTGAITASGPGGANIDTLDVSVNLIGGTQIEVVLGPDFQRLTGNETATITVPYTLTGNGGETSTANLVITVNGVNDLPVAVSDLTGNTMTEDAAATTFDVLLNDTLDQDHGAANTISTGTVTASGPVGAGIDAGDVTVNVIGGTQIRVTLQSDFQRLQEGQTATIDVPYTLLGDGADASTATFRVTVSGTNDAPVVTAGAGTSYTENAAAVSIAGSLTLTDIDNTTMSGAVVTLTNAQAGDVLSVQGQGTSGDLASGVHFVVDNTAHTVTFSNVETAADYQAALRLVQFNNSSENPATAARSFTINADDGQTLNHSGSAAASLTVVAINDAPVNTVPANNAVPTAFSNTNTAISGISIADVDSGSAIITTQLSVAHGTVAVTLAGGASISAGASGSATVTLSGTAAQINATLANNVTYRSTDGYVGPDDLSVVTSDLGNTGTGGTLGDSDTVQIGVVAQVWYIDNSNSGAGNGAGTVADPFHSIAAFNASAGPGVNDYIVIRTGTGTYTGEGLNLQDGQQVYGAGEVLNLTNPVNGAVVNVLNGSGARPTINVTAANDQGIDLASGNTIKGVNITTVSGTSGLDDGNNAVGTLTVSNMTISGAGQAVDIDQGGALAVSLEAVSSSGGAQGIQLAGSLSGNFTVTGNLSIINSATTGIDISGNSGNYTFAGSSNVVSTGTHNAVSLNTAGSVSFSGGLDIDTTTGTGFSAAGGATITISGSGNSVASTTGQVLNWSGVSVGASGVTFGSLGATGTVAATAINLNNVDGTGTFSGGNVTIAGTSGGASDGIRIEGGSAATFNFSSATIDNAGNDGIELSGANGTVTFSSVDIDGAAASGLNIAGNTNAITVSGGSIGSTNDPGGNAVDIAGGSGNISIAASVTKNTAGGDVVEITGRTGGTVTFSGAISGSGGAGGIDIDANSGGTINFTGQTTLNTGAGNGVDLTSNTGATINFNAGGNGLDITTTTGVGFNATGGGTVNVQGSGNSISSSSATALNVVNTTIGASNLTFQSISSGNNTAAADPVSGIILNNTGNSGGLIVTGTDGGDAGTTADTGTGGTIQNASGDAIVLNDTRAVSLNGITITNATGGSWIDADNVTGLTLGNVNANNSFAHGIDGTNITNLVILEGKYEGGGTLQGIANINGINITNLLGTSSITDATFERANTVQFRVNNNAATNFNGTPDTLTVSGTTWQNQNVSPFHGDHLSVSADTGGNFRLIVNSNDGVNTFKTGGIAVQAGGAGSGKMDADISGIVSGGTLASGNNNTAGVAVIGTASSTVRFNVHDNTTLGTGSVGMTFNDFTSGSFSGTIQNNNITHIAGNGTDALQIVSHGEGNGVGTADGIATIAVLNNTIVGNFQRGIRAQVAFDQSLLNLNITGNTVHGTDLATSSGFPIALRAIEVEVGGSGGGTSDDMFLNLQNNNAWMDNGNAGYRLFHRAGYTFSLEDLTGSGTDAANITNWIDVVKGNNSNGGAATTLITGVANGFSSHATTPAPLLAAPGGVAGSSPGDNDLTPAELAPIVAAAIARWADAGATPAQLARLSAITFTVADLSGDAIGEHTAGHIVLDTDAAGHGWFIDSTPSDNFEFAHAADAAGTELFADPASAAAGHLDLLTAVMHEMGHELGLGHSAGATDARDLMYDKFVDGERRLPDAADLAPANPGQAQAPPVSPSPAIPLAQFMNYNFAEGDSFDFSALTPQFQGYNDKDGWLVRAMEDTSGTFATPQLNTSALWQQIASWFDVAQIDGAHASDGASALIDKVYRGQIDVELLT